MIGIHLKKIENNSFDLYKENGKFVFVSGSEQIAQHVMIRLLKFKGESVVNDPNEDGTDWYGIIFNAAKTKNEKQIELKRRILGTPGIVRIINFVWTQDVRTINLNVKFETIYGDAEINEAVTPI